MACDEREGDGDGGSTRARAEMWPAIRSCSSRPGSPTAISQGTTRGVIPSNRGTPVVTSKTSAPGGVVLMRNRADTDAFAIIAGAGGVGDGVKRANKASRWPRRNAMPTPATTKPMATPTKSALLLRRGGGA